MLMDKSAGMRWFFASCTKPELPETHTLKDVCRGMELKQKRGSGTLKKVALHRRGRRAVTVHRAVFQNISLIYSAKKQVFQNRSAVSHCYCRT